MKTSWVACQRRHTRAWPRLVSTSSSVSYQLSYSEKIQHLSVFRQTFTLLLQLDQDAWPPWELLHDGQTFLGERFLIGQWPRELSDMCPFEFPIGTMHIAHFANVSRSMAKMWSSLFESIDIPPFDLLPGGMFDTLGSIEEMRGLYLMRFGQAPGAPDSHDTPMLYASMNEGDFIERGLLPVKLNIRRNRPLVSSGFLSSGLPQLTALEQTWAPTFIRAGCSAFVGSLWAVQPLVEAAFVSGFYQRLWAGDSLGEAFNMGRKLARIGVPESLDWLAHVLFGDPMARPYRPIKGQGYAVIEPIGREIEDPLPLGGSARFRVSLRRIPPIWHEERVIEMAEELAFEKLEVNIVASGLQIIPPSPIRMTRTLTGDYLGWFTLAVSPKVASNTHVVQVYFMDGVQPIHRLRFSLMIGKQGDDQL